MRIAFEDDLETHTILCTLGGAYLLCLDVEVCAYRSIKNNDREFCVPKWTVRQAQIAVALARDVLPRTTLRRSELDPFERTLARTSKPSPDILHSVHLAAWSLGALVATLRAVDLRVDFAVRELGDIDIDATRDTIQRNMGWLRERANGPIRVGERRFSTHHIERLTTDGRQLNLSIPLLACSSILTCLENVRGAEGAYYIVGSVHHRLQKLSDPRAPIPLPGRIKAWREEIPISPASVRLRNGLLRVMALAHDAARQSELSDGAKGLIPGFLEDRLFETWCWAALYEALGGTETGQKAIGKLQIGDAELVASGLAGGKARCRILLQGWRDDSVLPSNYAPDFLVRYPMQRPILIDAKFRMASSCGEPCSADAFKEVQAYLDEFSLIGAIILVPTMPSSVAKGADSAGAVAVEGLSNGGLTKRVWVVEVGPGIKGQAAAIKLALADLCALSG